MAYQHITRQALEDMHSLGLTYEEMAIRLGVGMTTVMYHAKKLSLCPDAARRFRRKFMQRYGRCILDVLNQRKEGVTLREIGEDLGISREAVRQNIKRAEELGIG